MRRRLLAAGFAALLAALAAAAPAGATLVYTKNRTSLHLTPSVWIAADDGSGARRLARGTNAHISPDGQTVLYRAPLSQSQQEDVLRKIPAGGGTPTALIAKHFNGSVFAWSPDSKSLLTTVGTPGYREKLVVIDVATGAERHIAQGYFSGGSWSPDGSAFVFGDSAKPYTGGGDLYVAPAAGGAPVQITSSGNNASPVWGLTRVAFSRATPSTHKGDYPKLNISLINPDGTGETSLTNDKVRFLLAGLTPLAFSADGTRLLTEFGGEDTGYGVRVDATTGAEKVLGKAAENGIIGTAISKDGTLVLAQTGGFDPETKSNVVTFAWNGNVPKTLVKNAAEPDWNR